MASVPEVRRNGAMDSAYETALALHAVAVLTEKPGKGGLAGLPDLVHYIKRRVETLTADCLLPARPLRCDVPTASLLGLGALLAEALEPGSTSLQDELAVLTDAGMTDALYDVLEQVENVYGDDFLTASRDSLPLGPSGDGDVHILLEPVRGWSVIATVTAEFSASPERASSPQAREQGGVSGFSRAWSPLGEEYLAETDRGLTAARRLVASLGRPQPPHIEAVLDPIAVQRPSTACSGTTAAAVALTYVAREARLPTPAQLGVLPLAGINPDGKWTTARNEKVGQEAAHAAGMRVLRCTTTGWLLDGIEQRDLTLNGAAQALWGEKWTAVRRRWDTEALQAHRWRILYASQPAPIPADTGWGTEPAGLPLIETPHVSRLQDQYVLQTNLTMILGGPANSGKSVIARQLARRLEGLRWRTLTLAPMDRTLPLPEDLLAIVGSALRLTGITPDARTLVVLDDLRPLERWDIGSTVSALANRLGVSVLALARYGRGSGGDWESGTVSPLPAVVGREDVTAFARQLVEDHPDTYGSASGLLPLLIEASQRDLWMLVRLMRDAARRSDSGEAVTRDRVLAGFIRDKIAGTGLDHAQELRTVVAVSLVGESVPEEFLSENALELLTRLGVRQRDGEVQVPSAEYAKMLFDELSPPEDALRGHDDFEEKVIPLVARHLSRLLSSERSGHVLRLLRACRAFDLTALEALLVAPEVWQGIERWAVTARPSYAAAVLAICDRYMEPEWVAALLPRVLDRVPETPGLDSRELSSVLSLVARYPHHLQNTDVLARFMQWLSEPESGLSAVLACPASLADRYYVARNLLRLHHERSPELIIDRTAAFLRGFTPTSAHDLMHIRKLDILLARCHRECGRQFEGRPLERYPQIQDLLDYRPPNDAKADAIVAWISLKIHFDNMDWIQLISDHENRLRTAFGNASGPEIAAVLGDLAKNHRGFCTKMMNHLRLDDRLRDVLRRATPADAAQVISTVGKIHSATVRALLYREVQGMLVPDEDLARMLANRIIKLKDGKGAGMLLSSTHKADALYCSTKETFAGTLAEHLGANFALQQVNNEIRASVLYHLLRGLWEAGASYRRQAEDRAFRLIVSTIRSPRRANRPFAAQLALLLAADDYFGEEFLKKLADAIEPQLLAQRMAQPGLREDAALHLHRLGRAVHPEVAQYYRAKLRLDRLLASFVPATASAVAQQLQVAATTLWMGGEESANALLLREFKEMVPGWDWGVEAGKAHSAFELSQTLNILYKLDPATATEATVTLTAVREDRRFNLLEEFVLRYALEPVQLTELLQSVEKVRPGYGRTLLQDHLQQNQLWDGFTKELQYEQDPITQGRTGRHLAGLGVIPQRGNLSWMKSLFNERWLKVTALLASPRAVTELLKLSYIWNRQWGHRLAASIDHGKIINRVRLGATWDLREIPGLLHILTLTGQREFAQELIDELEEFPADTLMAGLGLISGSQLLRRLQAQRPSIVPVHGHALARVLDQVMQRRLVIDPELHWKSIGWAAQALRQAGLESLLPTAAPNVPINPAHGAELCWAATWLSESDWTQRTLDEAFPAFLRAGRSWCQAEQVAMMLVAGFRSGRVDDPADDELYWSFATEAPLGTLTMVFHEGMSHDGGRAFLSSLKPELHKRLLSVVHQIDPWLGDLRSYLSRLPDPVAPDPASLFGPPDGEMTVIPAD